MSETRKIAAILVSDVVGYSRLAGADEDRTLARLRALRSDLIDPTISVHHGRIVKRTGDGLIVEFSSVVDAVRCAIEVQNAMAVRNAGVPADQRIEFRVGIHLGDVVEESDGDLMGDGVNIAARLESIAEPGAICLSEDAYRQVSGRLDMAVTDLGPTQLQEHRTADRGLPSLRVGTSPAQAKPATTEGEAAPAEKAFAARAADRRDRRAHRNRGRNIVFLRWKPPLAQRAQTSRRRTFRSWRCRSKTSPAMPGQDWLSPMASPDNLTTDLSHIRDSFVDRQHHG